MTTSVPASIHVLLSKADPAGGADEELISSVEQQHGLRFPGEYRAFLGEYGAALFSGFEVYGLVESGSDDPPLWSDVRMLLQNPAFKKMPGGLVPISDDGGDYKFYLKCDHEGSSELGSILVYGPGRDGVVVSKSFFEFIERAATQGISSLIL